MDPFRERILSECSSQQSPFVRLVWIAFEHLNIDDSTLLERLEGRPLIDIGCGKKGVQTARRLQSADLGITNVISVDPFQKTGAIDGFSTYVREDGLSFLEKYIHENGPHSANVLIAGIDSEIIPNPHYRSELYALAWRTVPESGLLLWNCVDEELVDPFFKQPDEISFGVRLPRTYDDMCARFVTPPRKP